MLKLYKREEDGALRYWEAWEEAGALTVHWGRVGEGGQVRARPLAPGEDVWEALAAEAEPWVDAGYDEPEPEALVALVVQYALEGRPSAHDLQRRVALEELLSDHLGWTGNGEVEGGELAAGQLRIHLRVMDADTAARTVVEALDEEDLLVGALVARQDEGAPVQVLWPPPSPPPPSGPEGT